MSDHTQHSELFKGQLSIHYMLSLFPAVTHDMSAKCILYYYIIKKRIIIIIKFTDLWNHTVHNNKLSLILCFFQWFHSCFTITPIVSIISRLAVGCLNITWCTCWPWQPGNSHHYSAAECSCRHLPRGDLYSHLSLKYICILFYHLFYCLA